MIKKLVNLGGKSKGLILDKSILRLLNISETASFKISTDGNRIILEPLREDKEPCK